MDELETSTSLLSRKQMKTTDYLKSYFLTIMLTKDL